MVVKNLFFKLQNLTFPITFQEFGTQYICYGDWSKFYNNNNTTTVNNHKLSDFFLNNLL